MSNVKTAKYVTLTADGRLKVIEETKVVLTSPVVKIEIKQTGGKGNLVNMYHFTTKSGSEYAVPMGAYNDLDKTVMHLTPIAAVQGGAHIAGRSVKLVFSVIKGIYEGARDGYKDAMKNSAK